MNIRSLALSLIIGLLLAVSNAHAGGGKSCSVSVTNCTCESMTFNIYNGNDTVHEVSAQAGETLSSYANWTFKCNHDNCDLKMRQLYGKTAVFWKHDFCENIEISKDPNNSRQFISGPSDGYCQAC